ncbi:MAG: hypothetical protein CM15mP120_24960 [Pseudomonadota bacterium]|nr:MAG: hypothetical protein CM15mP120_24960 [Pseudomonadota bacterium]
MTPSELCKSMVAALEDMKGQEILSINVSKLTPMTDHMIVVSGGSNRHVKALVDAATESSKPSVSSHLAWRAAKVTSGC